MHARTENRRVTFLMFAPAIGTGTAGTLFTRASNGFRKWRFILAAIAAYTVATLMMALLLQRLPVGLVYAVWTGAAAVVLLVIDRFAFKVKISGPQLAGLAVTVLGVALLGTATQA